MNHKTPFMLDRLSPKVAIVGQSFFPTDDIWFNGKLRGIQGGTPL